MVESDINSEDKLVQATFAGHLEKVLGWEQECLHHEGRCYLDPFAMKPAMNAR